MERNNNQGMLPKNRSGKDDEIIKMIHTLTTRKEGENLDKPGTTTTETFEYIDTDKLDPTIGSNCKIEQEQTFIEGSESTPTTQSLPKLNRDERLSPTDQKEHYDTKQADKGKDNHEISTHHIDNTAKIRRG
jgi:hypothetical protein